MVSYALVLLALCASRRAPRHLVCGQWIGVTSGKSLSCYRSTWNVSSLHRLWEKRRWLIGSCHRTTSSTHMSLRYLDSVAVIETLTACQLILLPVQTLVSLSSQGAGGVLTDFTSFYTLPSTVMHHPLHRSLKAAYSFYNVYTQTPLLDLMNDALILAKLVMFSCIIKLFCGTNTINC